MQRASRGKTGVSEREPPGSARAPPASSVRTAAERDALPVATQYAASLGHATPAEAEFLELLPGARRSILHRLLISLFRESPDELAAPRIEPAAGHAVPGAIAEHVPGAAVDPLPAELRGDPEAGHRIACLPLPQAHTVLLSAVTAVHGYNRFRIEGPAVAWSPDGWKRIDHPVEVVELLEADGAFVDEVAAEGLRSELAESVANLALARLAARGLVRESAPTTDDPLVAAAPSGADLGAALERLAAVEERPLNPSGKIRRGMSAADAPVYAPEFTDTIHLRFVAIDRDAVYETDTRSSEPFTAQLFSLFEGLERATDRALPTGSGAGDVAVVPVHPWQFHHTLHDRFADEFDAGLITMIPGYTVPATPLLNLRTVVPWPSRATVDHPAHLKLPIDVQKSNHVRTLPMEEVHNAPRASDLIRSILRTESFDAFGILADRAATAFRPPADGPADARPDSRSKHLGAAARENPHAHPLVSDDDTPVAGASLLAIPPDADRPLVCACIDRFADATGQPDEATAARRFLEAYVDLIVPVQLSLTAKYGIALETHLQNLIVVLDSACRPTGALVRDFGGIRVLPERLESQGRSINTYPRSDIDATTPEDLYVKTNYTFFQVNMVEFVRAIAHHTAVDEADCWDVVRGRVRRTLDTLRDDDTVPTSWVERDERALFAERTIHGSRVSMRLSSLDSKPYKECVRNPLAGFRAVVGG